MVAPVHLHVRIEDGGVKLIMTHGYMLSDTGSNVYVQSLCRALAREGHEVHLLCQEPEPLDRKSTRLNSSHLGISYAVFCLKKKKNKKIKLYLIKKKKKKKKIKA